MYSPSFLSIFQYHSSPLPYEDLETYCSDYQKYPCDTSLAICSKNTCWFLECICHAWLWCFLEPFPRCSKLKCQCSVHTEMSPKTFPQLSEHILEDVLKWRQSLEMARDFLSVEISNLAELNCQVHLWLERRPALPDFTFIFIPKKLKMKSYY